GAGLALGGAAGGLEGREVSRWGGWGSQERDGWGGRGPCASRLEAGEGEQLVLLDRPADEPPELVSAQGILRGSEEVARIEGSISYEFEKPSVKLIRSRLGDRVDHGAGMQSVTGGNAAGLDTEFLQRVGEREGQVHVRMRVVMISAVQQVIVSVDLASGDGNTHGGGVIMCRDHAARCVRGYGRAAGQEDQIGCLPPV